MKKEKNLPIIKQVSTEPYKGVRDFYPEDLAIQKFIFKAMRSVAESFGYEEYDASILEPTELYKAKSGEEIINEQTYSFEDRGGRNVTLRPEMTPSLARMVARKKRELVLPLRWYSLPNLFRYERPQRGRVREHWHLNADIFGVAGIEAEVEIISLGYQIMKKLRARDDDFVIKINNRKLTNSLMNFFGLDNEQSYRLSKLIDKKNKIEKDDFERQAREILNNRTAEFLKLLNSENISDFENINSEAVNEIKILTKKLNTQGIKNIIFDPSLIRGFDYYTGIVFELFDIDPENNRSLFGGGRYDDLLDIFGAEKIPAVGFGMGDVTTRDFLETRNLLPEYQSKTDLYICALGLQYIENTKQLAARLREAGLNVAVNYSDKKVGDQIAVADKKAIPYILCVGENEIQSGKFKLKDLRTGEEKEVGEEKIVDVIKLV
ncbi:MAG: histidine--tRNA ligase [Candidatus Pacebacteria bacterium]|nr:histidine--tRNA ligase [Candidatus Paceibacterota bacterium]